MGDAEDKGTVMRAFLHLHHSSLKSQLRKDCEKGKEDNTGRNQQNRVAKKKERGISRNQGNGSGLHTGSGWSRHDGLIDKNPCINAT